MSQLVRFTVGCPDSDQCSVFFEPEGAEVVIQRLDLLTVEIRGGTGPPRSSWHMSPGASSFGLGQARRRSFGTGMGTESRSEAMNAILRRLRWALIAATVAAFWWTRLQGSGRSGAHRLALSPPTTRPSTSSLLRMMRRSRV